MGRRGRTRSRRESRCFPPQCPSDSVTRADVGDSPGRSVSVDEGVVPVTSANNLTREEAQARSALLRVHSYDLHLDLTTSDKTFRSTSRVRFDCTDPGASARIDLTAPEVLSITLNGADVDTFAAFDGNHVTLSGLAASNELVVVADCAYSHTGEGLHRFVDPIDDAVYLYSQFETSDAHRVYACF